MKTVTMLYRDYVRMYSEYKKVYGTYDTKNKTIEVELPDDMQYIPSSETEEWKSVYISKNNVSIFNDKVLIKLPNKSEYKKWEMWVSRKLVRVKGETVELRCKVDFEFTIKKKDCNPLKITAEELAELFKAPFSEQEYPEIHTPKKLEPIKREALAELIDK